MAETGTHTFSNAAGAHFTTLSALLSAIWNRFVRDCTWAFKQVAVGFAKRKTCRYWIDIAFLVGGLLVLIYTNTLSWCANCFPDDSVFDNDVTVSAHFMHMHRAPPVILVCV
jgi:hypothetical protein